MPASPYYSADAVRPVIRIAASAVAMLALAAVAPAVLLAQDAATSSFTDLALSLVRPVRSGMTLGAWRAAHPSDSIGPVDDANGCAEARRRVAISARETVDLSIDFYIPATPADLHLPPPMSASALRGQCRARNATVVVRDTSDSRMQALKKDIDGGLARMTAPGEPHQREDSMTFTVTPSSHLEADGTERVVSVHTLAVGLLSHRPQARLSPGDTADFRPDVDYDRQSAADQRENRWLRAALEDAQIGGKAGRDFRAIFERLARSSESTRLEPVLTALSEWIGATKRLSGPRLSAALFVADAVVERWPGGSDLDDSSAIPVHDSLAAIGASVTMESSNDGMYIEYHRNWLMQAYLAAPESRAGRTAFLTMLELGFREMVPCEAMAPTVLDRATAYLRKYPATPLGGELHLLRAMAWADIWSASRVQDESISADSATRMHQRGDDARKRAIAEFVVAFRLDRDSTQLRWLWPNVWRVMAGSEASVEFFDCRED